MNVLEVMTMTPEARLDRLERIAKLFVKAGLRARGNLRELDERFDMLINMQIQNEEKFARNEARFAQTDKKLARLAVSQARTDHNLAQLIKFGEKGRNGEDARGK